MIYRQNFVKELTFTAIGIFVVILAVLVSTQAINLLGRAADGRVAVDAVAALIGFWTLGMTPLLLVLTAYISTLTVLTRFWRDSEMSVWLSCGLSLRQWVRPVLSFALPFAALVAAMQLSVLPWAELRSREFAEILKQKQEHEGVYHNQVELDSHKDRQIQFYAGTIPTANRKPMVGDTRWKDVNGDGIIDSRDRVVLGRTTPDFIGGFTTDFTYKNINLFIKTDYAVGHLVHNGVRSRGISQVQGNMNWISEIKDTWTPENPNADIPRYDFTA